MRQETHFEATLARMSRHSVILIPQDTTILNFSTQYERKDAGPTTKDSSHGIYLHSAIAVTPEKICLGVVSGKQWYREALQKLTRRERTRKDYSTPIEDKESYRWLENYKNANEIAAALPETKIVSMADREGDIYDIYKEANRVFSREGAKAHYIIRAKTNRKTCTAEGKKTAERIKSSLKSEKALGEISLEISETKKRKSRTAQLTVYSKKVYIALPDKFKKDKDYKPIEITAILCTELNPPADAELIEWLLLTDLPAITFEEACEKIQWYTCRWQIEIFFC